MGITSLRRLALVFAVGVLGAVVVSGTAFAGTTQQISASGITSWAGGIFGSDGIQSPEFAGIGEAASPDAYGGVITDRSHSSGGKAGKAGKSAGKAKSNPELGLSFDGLNFRQQRLANGGNQFSVEPPDQGMCAGNGYVLESVNDVIRVYKQSDGSPATPVVDLNTFYGYPPAINRTTGVRGQFVTDPSCLYDAQTQRWFNVVLTLETKPNGAFTLANHLDVAVSNSADPTGTWTVYRLDVTGDGSNPDPGNACPCLGDYPHIGADANGFYVTTNSYPWNGNGFDGAQIYAFSKQALAAGAPTVGVSHIDTFGMVASSRGSQPGFTVWPAQSPGTDSFNSESGGTENFLSSNAADEAQVPVAGFGGTGESSEVVVWSLTNTSSLASASPSLGLTSKAIPVGQYAIPPKSEQKAGDFPLGQCLNTPSCATTFLLGRPDPFTEVISHLDSNDTRMQQVTFANGKLWGALDTALTVDGVNKAGIEYFVLNPNGKIHQNGYLGLSNNNLTYPAIGVTQSGRGVMAFTVVGNDYFPSAGYAGIDAKIGAGDVHVAAPGLGPDDGFTSYKAEVGNPPRTRWGDYGAAAVDGNTVWIASEYIGQTCTLAQYTSTPFGSCGGTRATLGNWDTRISAVTP